MRGHSPPDVGLAGLHVGHPDRGPLGRDDLVDDPRFDSAKSRSVNARECIAVLDEVFAERDLAEWIPLLRQLSTPWTLVQSAAETAVDPQVVANGYVGNVDGAHGPLPLVASPAQFDGRPPALTRAPDHGEQTEEILLELGRDKAAASFFGAELDRQSKR